MNLLLLAPELAIIVTVAALALLEIFSPSPPPSPPLGEREKVRGCNSLHHPYSLRSLK